MASNSSKNIHTPMDRANRAKQFMPFDALKGFREALAEKEKSIVLEIEFENYKYTGKNDMNK